MKAIAYWKMEKTLQTYILPLRITHPTTNVSLIKMCIFDTGFSGYLGLDQQSVQNLGLPKAGFGKALTASGEIHVDNFYGKVELMNTNQSPCGQIRFKESISIKDINGDHSVDEIPIQMLNLPLLGMKSIAQFRWLLLPDKEAICLLPMEESQENIAH